MTEEWYRSGGGISVRRISGFRIGYLRVRRPDPAAISAIEVVLGLALPTRVNAVAADRQRILAVGSGEWLIVGGAYDERDLLYAASGGSAAHLADITHGYATFEVTGRRAGDLLSKGCTLDFHDRVFTVGSCAQSALAQVFVTIDRLSADCFRIHADISLSEHLRLWLDDALIEFELGEYA